MEKLASLVKDLGDLLGGAALEGALEQLKDKGPLWAVVLSVAISIAALTKDFAAGHTQNLAFQFVTIFAGTAVFLAVLIVGCAYRTRRRRPYRVLKQLNQYDLQARGDGNIKVTCSQTLKIEARIDHVRRYSADHPLSGGIVARFEGEGRMLTGHEIRSYTGVGIDLGRPLKRREKKELSLTWEYESRPVLNELGTILRRPADSLEIVVVLPPGTSKPEECRWYLTDIAEPLPTGEGGTIDPQPHTGGRFSLRKEFPKPRGHLDYVIWWRL